jgi:hypothetical protein
MNSLQQQARFDAFMEEFNTERPHQALEMQRPAEVYFSSSRPYVGLARPRIPAARPRIPRHRLRTHLHAQQRINISTVLAGQKLGIKEVDDGIWLISFMPLRSRLHRPGAKTLQAIDNPFGTRLSPMS